MNELFHNMSQLYWLWAAAGVGVIVLLGVAMRRRAIRRFAESDLLCHLLPGGKVARWAAVRAVIWIAAVVLLVLALADPRWGRQWADVPQRGVDVVFVLDVSRSMFATDVTPNRLRRAKQFIRDIMEEMGGDRVGLITFAGRAKQIVPLTSNYSDMTMALEEVGPQSVGRGGTRIGDAIRLATRSFLDKTADHKAIVVITDGDDPESAPVKAAKVAYKEKGIRVYTVGLGQSKGAKIPLTDEYGRQQYLTYQGKEVVSRLGDKTLKETALAGGGAYIPVGTRSIDMGQVYRRHVRSIAGREYKQARIHRHIPRYQWFLAPAVGLLLIETLLGCGLGWPRRKRKEAGR